MEEMNLERVKEPRWSHRENRKVERRGEGAGVERAEEEGERREEEGWKIGRIGDRK